MRHLAPMSERTYRFEHDGHQFDAVEAVKATTPEPVYKWCVKMDGHDVLDFIGPFNYRDEDVRKRVLEWYALQKPITR